VVAKSPEKPLLAVTMGDPCGIGPELILRLLANRRARAAARYLVIGNRDILEKIAHAFDLSMLGIEDVTVEDDLCRRRTMILDAVPCASSLALKAKATAVGGRASIQWIETAIELAKTSRVAGMVTAPINKESIHRGGSDWPGHTELLATRTGVRKPVMMMIGGGLRAALVTTHAGIADLPRLITKKNVLETLRITSRDLRRHFGLRRPRIVVCGFNPHAGEAGRFGSEEARVIAPAIKQARSEGIACSGPTPADVVFTRRHMARFDAVVAMYHDQANIPVKLLAVETGVNVTLGLPIIRTSPDHGTAFEIVKRGVADVRSMVEAACMAANMATMRHGRP
jgi:4-hydroxythreonine-4-phosphate dehydrogenase